MVVSSLKGIKSTNRTNVLNLRECSGIVGLCHTILKYVVSATNLYCRSATIMHGRQIPATFEKFISWVLIRWHMYVLDHYNNNILVGIFLEETPDYSGE